MIRQIIAELQTPSGQTGPLHGAYDRAVQGLGHAMIGATLAGSLGGVAAFARNDDYGQLTKRPLPV